MKRRILATLLCICMLVGMSIPVHAATPNFSAELSESTLYVSEQPQTVTMKISASEAVAACCIDFRSTVPTGWSASAALTSEASAGITGTYNDQTGKFTSDAESNVEDLTDLAVITYTIPANTQAGTYTVGVTELYVAKLEENGVDTSIWADDISVSATLTIKDVVSADPYTANISTTDIEFTVGDPVVVTVNVGGTEGKFASSELELTYDSNYLTLDVAEDGTYESEHTLNGAGITVADGTIKLVDHGEANAYPEAYVLNFTAKAATTGAAELVTLTDAKFSTAENAISSDLTEAEGENALSLTINNADLNVDLTNASAVDGNTSVPYGADYTFTAKNNTTYMYYDYEVTVTMGGTDVTESVTFSNGTWTVSDVTDDLVIEVTETPKTFNVTWDGNSEDEVTDIIGINAEKKATYGTDITFKVPADKVAADSTDTSWTYTVSAVLTGTDNTVPVNKNGTDVTIEGIDITGAITITVTKNTVEATDTTITIDKDDVKATVNGIEVTNGLVEKGKDVVLDLTREPGYTYTVEVNDEDKTTEFDGDNSYTISNVQSPVTVVVTKTFDLSSANVQKYLTLNETNMWLVTINGNGDTEISGKTYSYDGQNMYWSPKYQAYCYLVVATDLSVTDAKAKIGTALVEADAIDVEYNKDVNNTNGKVDANDAQLVYNMYQTKAYDGFGTVDMIKFLEADLNITVGVDSTDAQFIIDYILEN